jgi:hypothetical protein
MARGLITSLIAGLGAPLATALAQRFILQPYAQENALEMQRQKMVDLPLDFQQKGYDLVKSITGGQSPVNATTGAPNYDFWNQAMNIPGYEGTKDYQQLAGGGAVNALAGPQAEVQRQLAGRYQTENRKDLALLPGQVARLGAENAYTNARTGLTNTENAWMPQMNQGKLNEMNSAIAKNNELIARSSGPERDKLVEETNQLKAKTNELNQGIKINQIATLRKSLEFDPSPEGQAMKQKLDSIISAYFANKPGGAAPTNAPADPKYWMQQGWMPPKQ